MQKARGRRHYFPVVTGLLEEIFWLSRNMGFTTVSKRMAAMAKTNIMYREPNSLLAISSLHTLRGIRMNVEFLTRCHGHQTAPAFVSAVEDA